MKVNVGIVRNKRDIDLYKDKREKQKHKKYSKCFRLCRFTFRANGTSSSESDILVRCEFDTETNDSLTVDDDTGGNI